MRKIGKLIIFIFLLFSLFLYFYLRKIDYSLDYNLENIKVTEKYNKKEKLYYININVNNKDYSYITSNKYTHKRKLIDEVKVNDNCITPHSNYLTLYSLCNKENNELIMPNGTNNDVVLEAYENINVYDYNAKTYLLWNYQNFIYMNQEEEKKYELFKNDVYSLKLPYQTDRYLFIPNQEDEFTFNSAYIIDTKKNKMNIFKLKKDLYFDSYIMGYKKNKIYLVDRKNKEEYEIDLKKNKLTRTGGKVLNNNKWEKIDINKLIHNDYIFQNDALVEYQIIDNYLYAFIKDIKIKITDKKVSSIVKYNDQEIYYISGDSLYYFNFLDNEKKLMSYNEWNFNYNNMIYIFD